MNDWTAGKTFSGKKKTKILPNVGGKKNKPNIIFLFIKKELLKKKMNEWLLNY